MSELESLINLLIDESNSQLRVCLPGRIEVYDPDTHLASVQPLIKRRFYQRQKSELLPIINRVPVVFPRSANALIRLPITKGDIVTLVFADRNISNWLSGNGDAKDHLDTRKHHLNDAYALLGGYPKGKPWEAVNPDALEIQVKPGTKITIGNGQEELIQLTYDALTKLNELSTQLSSALQQIQALTVTGNQGNPTSVPLNLPAFVAIQTNVDTITSGTNTLLSNLEKIKV